jgi:hypothetical protein
VCLPEQLTKQPSLTGGQEIAIAQRRGERASAAEAHWMTQRMSERWANATGRRRRVQAATAREEAAAVWDAPGMLAKIRPKSQPPRCGALPSRGPVDCRLVRE